jgi:hypothetical protein
MDTYNLMLTLASVLIIPLIPALIIYKYLPSKTAVKGPFKGLNINLTGAFGGYFLLVIIALGLTYNAIYNQNKDKLKESLITIDHLNARIDGLNAGILAEKNKYRNWIVIGQLDSKTPELTKIFIDEENISINALGKFKASIIAKTDDNNRVRLPGAVCFFNQQEGYSVVDLSTRDKVEIDSISGQISIREVIKLKTPVRYTSSNDLYSSRFE